MTMTLLTLTAMAWAGTVAGALAPAALMAIFKTKNSKSPASSMLRPSYPPAAY